ncbi:hypothetical protein D8S78_24295 [Natrialba swarupiae]|nr:hypothetical protein [Natrialba swarupiae]
MTIEETSSAILEGETLDVTTEVINLAADGGEQQIELLDFDDDQQDTETVDLDSGDSTEESLEWETEASDAGTNDVTVESDGTASEEVTIEAGTDSVTATIDDDDAPTVVTSETVDVDVTVEDETGEPIEDREIEIDALDDGGDDVTVNGLRRRRGDDRFGWRCHLRGRCVLARSTRLSMLLPVPKTTPTT